MDLEAMAAALEASGDYRVLRKLKSHHFYEIPDSALVKRALFVDVETTGLSYHDDEIIELAMVPFSYGLDGKIYELFEPFQSFQQPKKPIPAEITEITGITPSMVEGFKLDLVEIEQYIAGCDLIVAHNAKFDRKFLERFAPCFQKKPWACSATEVNWRREGFEGSRLGYLATAVGFFYDKHRALNDCYAAIELLAKPLPKSGCSGFSALLETARTPIWRIWAHHAPFELKDVLKERGYRWRSGDKDGRKAWYIDVSSKQKDAEIKYLQDEIYRDPRSIITQKIDAFDRFSERAD